MFKVSDFKIPAAFIKKACSVSQCSFVDLPVKFESIEGCSFAVYQDGCLYIGDPGILGETLSRITIAYLSSFCLITGTELLTPDPKDLFIHITSFFRFISFSDNSHEIAKPESGIAKRLYQNPFMWLLMKDIVGPAFGVSPITNFKMIESGSPSVDAACFVDEDSITKHYPGSNEEPFVFVNTDIEYKPYLYAHVFAEVIEGHGGNSHDMISAIFESSLADRVTGLGYLAFEDTQQTSDFMSCLGTIAGYENSSEQIIFDLGGKGKDLKTAQSGMGSNPYMNISDTWWFLGLIEQMLEPARGADWSTHQMLKPYTEGVWAEINAEREKRGKAGMSYEALLRFKSGEVDPDDVYILEKTLASDRVW